MGSIITFSVHIVTVWVTVVTDSATIIKDVATYFTAVATIKEPVEIYPNVSTTVLLPIKYYIYDAWSAYMRLRSFKFANNYIL